MTTADDLDEEEADMHLAKLQVASSLLKKRQVYVYSPIFASIVETRLFTGTMAAAVVWSTVQIGLEISRPEITWYDLVDEAPLFGRFVKPAQPSVSSKVAVPLRASWFIAVVSVVSLVLLFFRRESV